VDSLLPAFSPPEVTGRCQITNRFGIYLCRGSCRSDEELVGRAIDLPWRSLPAVSCLCYWAGQDFRDIVHDFPATQPTSAPREPSLWVRASLLTQAKFFRHERSCRSPRGDTQPLRLLIILVRTFDPPGHCYAWVRGQCISRFIDASLVAVSALLRGSLAARHLFLGQHARSGACGPQGRVLLPRLGAW
jgi:hypothetical protein